MSQICALRVMALGVALLGCAPRQLDGSNFENLFSAQSFNEQCKISDSRQPIYFGASDALPPVLAITGLKPSSMIDTQEIGGQSRLSRVTLFRASKETDYAFRLEFRKKNEALDGFVGLLEHDVPRASFDSQILGGGDDFEIASHFHLPGPLSGEVRHYLVRLKVERGYLVGLGVVIPVFERRLEQNFEVFRLRPTGQSFCLD
jgi:hypothetical protein